MLHEVPIHTILSIWHMATSHAVYLQSMSYKVCDKVDIRESILIQDVWKVWDGNTEYAKYENAGIGWMSKVFS